MSSEQEKLEKEMIATQPPDVCYIRIPKTASTSIDNALGKKGIPYKRWQEWNTLLPDYGKRFRFASVRHPYTRFQSAFRSCELSDTYKDVNDMLDQIEIESLFGGHQYSYMFTLQYPYIFDISEYRRVDFLIRYEEVDEGWRTLAGVTGRSTQYRYLRKSNVSKALMVELSQTSKDKIYEYYKDDFRLLGYKR